jgi:5-(hydroxymethyl)furfural/furfural oxidase
MFILPSNRAAWHPLGKRLASILVCVNKPYSTGLVRLAGPSPDDAPFINFRQLSDERDLMRLEDGMKRLQAVISSPAMNGVIAEIFPASFSERVRKLGAVNRKNWFLTLLAAGAMGTGSFARRTMIERIISPDASVRDLMCSDNALRNWIVENACGSWHASGTCRLGRADDPDAVVDPQARVIEVQGLRVVDASIMPSVVSANTMLTTIMAAEKIADGVKAGL